MHQVKDETWDPDTCWPPFRVGAGEPVIARPLSSPLPLKERKVRRARFEKNTLERRGVFRLKIRLFPSLAGYVCRIAYLFPVEETMQGNIKDPFAFHR
jgi:hypothetical protein